MQQIALICIKLKNAQLSAGSKDDFSSVCSKSLPFYPNESSTITRAVDTHRKKARKPITPKKSAKIPKKVKAFQGIHLC